MGIKFSFTKGDMGVMFEDDTPACATRFSSILRFALSFKDDDGLTKYKRDENPCADMADLTEDDMYISEYATPPKDTYDPPIKKVRPPAYDSKFRIGDVVTVVRGDHTDSGTVLHMTGTIVRWSEYDIWNESGQDFVVNFPTQPGLNPRVEAASGYWYISETCVELQYRPGWK